MYDVQNLRTAEQCRIVMERAVQQGNEEFYQSVFMRLCEIEGALNDDPSDPIVKEFFQTLAAYEQLLTEKNGRKTAASRTRQKIRNKGVHQSLVDWTLGNTETNGFSLLVERGMPQFTAEYLVARYASRFPEQVVARAHARLDAHGIARPEPT